MSFQETMDMPIRTFWSFAKNINRIRASEEIRLIDVQLAGSSGEIAEKVRSKLQEEMGTISTAPIKPVNHSEGIGVLKSLAGRMKQG